MRDDPCFSFLYKDMVIESGGNRYTFTLPNYKSQFRKRLATDKAFTTMGGQTRPCKWNAFWDKHEMVKKNNRTKYLYSLGLVGLQKSCWPSFEKKKPFANLKDFDFKDCGLFADDFVAEGGGR